jgi:LAO/AO transport system kinase
MRGSGAAGRRGRKAVTLSEATGRNSTAPTDAWEQPVVLTSAVKGEGISDLVAALDRHHDWLSSSGELEQRRRRRLMERTREVVDRATRKWVWEETRAEQLINERLDQVADGQMSPYELAQDVLDELKQGEKI